MTQTTTLPPVAITARRSRSDDVTLEIGGTAWGGWTEVRVTRGIERLPRDFDVQLTEFMPAAAGTTNAFGQSIPARQILRGDTCVLKIGGEAVVTGFIDRVLRSMDSRTHHVTITGRSKCADLVDCAAEWPGGQIVGDNVLSIAEKLCKPYGIKVTCAGDPGPAIPQFNLMRGETPFEIIERLCRFGQLLAYDTTKGDLLLTGASDTQAASGFQQGINVIRAEFAATLDGRFSEYVSYTQSVETTSDLGDGLDLISTVTDDTFPLDRHRRRILISETSGPVGENIARATAQWEMRRRQGRSEVVRITTDSWRDADGELYAPNTQALVDLPAFGFDPRSLTIGEVTYRRGDSGTLCDLTLMSAQAFTPQPLNVLQLLPFAEMAQTTPGGAR